MKKILKGFLMAMAIVIILLIIIFYGAYRAEEQEKETKMMAFKGTIDCHLLVCANWELREDSLLQFLDKNLPLFATVPQQRAELKGLVRWGKRRIAENKELLNELKQLYASEDFLKNKEIILEKIEKVEENFKDIKNFNDLVMWELSKPQKPAPAFGNKNIQIVI